MQFHERLTQLMEEQEITAYKLSMATNIPQTMLGRWKKGEQTPSLEKVLILSDYFGVTSDYLLGKTDIKNKPAAESGNELTEYEKMFMALSPDKREEVLRYGRYLLEKEGKK